MSKLSPYITLIAVFILLVLGSLYVSHRFMWSIGSGAWIFYFLGFFFLVIFAYVAVFAFISKTDKLSHFIYLLGAFTMGFVLYFLISTVFVDLLYLIIKLSPKYFNFFTIGLTAILSTYGFYHSKKIQVTEQTIEIKGLKNNFKAVHLSDIHIGRFRSNAEYLQEIIDKTNAQNPDIIFFTGDYLDAAVALKDKHFAPLSKLEAPIYFVEGNHDVVVNAPVVLKKAKKYGAKVLANEMIEWNEIQIIGLNHMVQDESTYSRHTTSKKSTIKKVLYDLAPDINKPSILLHHSPDGIKYASKHAIDLYLAGHTHGGQMWPITKISDYFFPYNKGLSRYKNTSIIVSQGIGTAGPPMRLGTNAEIVVIHLVPLL